jgi:sulfoxide reductase heme-binding subunit YedZ
MSIPGESNLKETTGARGKTSAVAGAMGHARGLWLVGAAVLSAMAVSSLLWQPGVDGVRWLIRATARTSLLFFLLAYTAEAAVTTWPGVCSSWQRRHRRQWGWLVVTSHGLHAAGIISLAWMAPALFATLSPPVQRIGPGVAYVFIALMGLTSFDRTASWLGTRRWARLHTWGMHYIWLSFLVANGKRVAAHPVYALPTLLLLAALIWRLLASTRQHKALRAEPATAGPA